MTDLRCRLSGEPLRQVFCDLGVSPLSNSYVPEERLLHMEPFYPLTAYVGEKSLLVQLPAAVNAAEIFSSEYAYFSSFSDSWLQHARRFAEAMIERFQLDASSFVVEVASNDGYLLRWFRERGIAVLGVEPAANCAAEAEKLGIPSLVDFFGRDTANMIAARGQLADLIAGNNVFAHVPDLHDFTSGLARLLKPTGVLTLEFPHLLQLMEQRQFDTIYHEHFSYFSLITAERTLKQHGLLLFDVEELETHGGSLRIYARRADGLERGVSERLRGLRERERAAGLHTLETYLNFQPRVEAIKRDLLDFLITARRQGKRVVGYGAPAKGNTLLNYCGVRTDMLEYTVDRSPHKQGRYLPGSRIPIRAPEALRETKPDYVLILPWNLQREITEQVGWISEWNGQFVVPIPEVRILG